MNITVSPLSQNDRSEWQHLYRAYADFYKMPMTDETLNTVWSWIFDPSNTFYCLIAKDESGNGIGLMHYREMPSPLRGAHVGFLDDLFVAPSCRGKGVVEALYKALDQEAKHHGWPFVRWITAEDNHRARSVYDKISEKTHWVTYQMPANC
jgi:GNAT superfamily N-acetyltransferase